MYTISAHLHQACHTLYFLLVRSKVSYLWSTQCTPIGPAGNMINTNTARQEPRLLLFSINNIGTHTTSALAHIYHAQKQPFAVTIFSGPTCTQHLPTCFQTNVGNCANWSRPSFSDIGLFPSTMLLGVFGSLHGQAIFAFHTSFRLALEYD